MKRWTLWATRLYPRAWRDRYGAEFHALLEDSKSGWSDLADVVLGALRMQSRGVPLKLVAVFGLTGILVALAVSLRVPPRYVSRAVIRLTVDSKYALSPEDARSRAAFQFFVTKPLVLSRVRLDDMIRGFDLYSGERHRLPVEELVLRMRRDLAFEPVTLGQFPVIAISFAYFDPHLAQAVVNRLVTDFSTEAAMFNRAENTIWQDMWKQESPRSGKLDVLAAATLSNRDSARSGLSFAVAGLLFGLGAGALAAGTYRRPGTAFRIAACGAAGFCVTALICALIPAKYTSTAFLALTAPVAPEFVSGKKAVSSAARAGKFRSEVASLGYRDIRIEPQVSPFGLAGYRIESTNADPALAVIAMREAISTLRETNHRENQVDMPELERHRLAAELVTLESPSPPAPAGTDRLGITLGGMTAGLLFGPLAFRNGRGCRAAR